MSDARVRDAERRWRETGDPVEEARLLLERLRAGTLERADLEVLLHVGHAATLVALDRLAPPPEEPGKVVSLLRRWGRWRLPAAAALGLAVAMDRPRAAALLVVARAAVTDRSEEVRTALRGTLDAFLEGWGRFPSPSFSRSTPHHPEMPLPDRAVVHAATAVRDERVAEAMQAARAAELVLGRTRTLDVVRRAVAELVLGVPGRARDA